MSDDITARARRRTSVIAAVVAAVVMVVAAAAVGLATLLGHRDVPVSRPAPAGTVSTDASHPSAVPASRPDSGSVQDLSWVTVAGARVPVSRQAGPRTTGGGRVSGFSRTPLGAVLAAAHISLRLCPQVGPQVFEATLREQVVGADTAALRQHLEDDYQQARAQLGLAYGQPAGRLYSTARGYRVRLVGDTAEVRLLIEGPGPSGSVLIAVSLQMRWTGGDWALVAPPGGVWDDAAAPSTDTTGYTRFPDGG